MSVRAGARDGAAACRQKAAERRSALETPDHHNSLTTFYLVICPHFHFRRSQVRRQAKLHFMFDVNTRLMLNMTGGLTS